MVEVNFRRGSSKKLCDKQKIKQEKTTADPPQSNGVAKRAISIIESAGLAAKIQALGMYPNQDIPSGNSPWTCSQNSSIGDVPEPGYS